jgi:aquaporin Z
MRALQHLQSGAVLCFARRLGAPAKVVSGLIGRPLARFLVTLKEYIMKQYGAEFLGTFWLVLGGCGSAVLAAGFPA